jgi:4-carboxymuconolactone decarboxylase
MTNRFDKGMSLRRMVLENAHVERAEAAENFAEIPMHIRATARTGATKQDVIEAFQHVAIYAGVPAAHHAIKLAKQTYADMEAQTK